MANIFSDDDFRPFDDIDAQRRQVYRRAREGLGQVGPLTNATHSLELADVGYDEDDDDWRPPKATEKKAILQGVSLHRPLHATLRLRDNATGQVLDERRAPIARIPHLNSRGLFIRKGVVWALRNQQRLRPGIYMRRKADGGSEAHFNIKPSTGRGFRILMEPESGLFKLQVGQSTTRLYPLLRSLGVKDEQIKQAWGPELFEKNFRRTSGHDEQDLRKLVTKLGPKTGGPVDADLLPKVMHEILARAEVDPETTEITMGRQVKNLSPEDLLDAATRALAVQRGERRSDNRDSQAFQTVHSAEDFIEERLKRDQAGGLRRLLWKASKEGRLPEIQAGVLDRNLDGLFQGSGLAMAVEDINPFEIHDARQAVTRLGHGGISSERAVSRDARGVQASYVGVIDAGRGPESSRLGLDLRVTDSALKGPDNQLYTKVINARTGEPEIVSARTLSQKVVTFPGEMEREGRRVPAVKDDGMTHVLKRDVDYIIPNPNALMSRATAMIPFPESVKGQRLLMGARMTQQAMPLKEAEAPLVQTAGPDGSSLHRAMGSAVGAQFSDIEGVVTKVTPDEIQVTTPDGQRKVITLYNNYPAARKTVLHNTPVVEKGSYVKPGKLVARSNFTDGEGTAAIGRNLRVAFMAAEGDTIEDAFVISESAAKKLTSEALYKSDLDLSDIQTTNKQAYRSIYADRFTPAQYDALDDDGVIREGVEVKSGDPLILGMARKPKRGVGAVMPSPKSQVTDRAQTWDHHAPGVVTDVVRTRKGIKVSVKSYDLMRAADKLCYSPDHDVLTERGWVPVTEVTRHDRVASLNPETHRVEYVSPVKIHAYQHDDLMYEVETTQVSMCVTPDHHLYASRNVKKLDYGLRQARDVAGKPYRLKMDGVWEGESPDVVTLPGLRVAAGQGGRGSREIPSWDLPVDTYMMLLGLFISEGNIFNQPSSGSYGIDITQIKPHTKAQIVEGLEAAGIKFCDNNHGKLRIHNRQLMEHFRGFGKCHEKRIPSEVFSYSREHLLLLFKWVMLGDGHVGKSSALYTTTSAGLADDVQRLCLHIGYAGRVSSSQPSLRRVNGGATVSHFRRRYDVHILRSKLAPTINHGHTKTQGGQKERWVSYSGTVHCVTLERNHVLYVRRNGKPHWSGNTGRYGNKGVISSIRPDDQMPQDEEGRPIEVIANSLGIVSRTNPAALAEALLGKVAAKTGKPYAIQGFSGQGVADFALRQAVLHGVAREEEGRVIDTETLTDPRDGRKIRGVFTGVSYFMKPHHMAESKLSARDVSSYTTEGFPARGGKEGSKRVGLADLHSLLAAGATEFIKDAKLVRGQRNDDYWRQLRLGEAPIAPTESFADEHFKALLRGAGVNLREKGSRTQLSPLLDRDVDRLAEYEIENPSTFNFETMKPVPGGLFDLGKTGGADGNRYTKITLPRAVPHPLFAEPIQRLLDLTGKGLEDVLAGRRELGGRTGPEAVARALSEMNIDQEIARAKETIKLGRKSKRDLAVKKLNFLTGLKKMDVSPSELLVTKIPVIPPKYRPIVQARNMDMVNDLNYLYHDLLEARENYSHAQKEFGKADDEYLTMWRAVQAISGVRDPVSPKSAEQGVKGILRYAIGIGSSPKCYDDQTEILTPDGWVAFPDFSGGRVATVNPDSGAFEWQTPTDVIHQRYQGVMVGMSSKTGRVDSLVTPNHEHYVAKRNVWVPDGFSAYKKVFAGNCVGPCNRMRMLVAARSWAGTADDYTFNGSTVSLDDFASFVGWWLAEGWNHQDGCTAYVCQQVSSVGRVKEIDELLERLGLRYSRAVYAGHSKTPDGREYDQELVYWGVNSSELVNWLRTNVGDGAKNKRLSAEIRGWSATALERLVAAYLSGDGATRYTEAVCGCEKVTFKDRCALTDDCSRVVTSSRALLDDLTEVLIKLGMTLGTVYRSEHTGCYQAGVIGWNFVTIDTNVKREFVWYDGHVHCVTVPNGLVIVRRNGATLVSGNSAFYQRKVVGSAVDTVGRGVITADKNLDMDEVGIPEDMAWSVYRPFVIRRLARLGVPAMDALKAVKARDPTATRALEEEMKVRPVVYNRAPALHRYAYVGAWPKIRKDDAIGMPYQTLKGLNGDFDGDQINIHVPTSDEAVADVRDKLLPSKNLFFTGDFETHLEPVQDYVAGLYLASVPDKDEKVRTFATEDEAKRAYANGQITARTPIRILRRDKD